VRVGFSTRGIAANQEGGLLMIRVAIVTAEGKVIKPDELTTAIELQQAVEQARNLIRDCDRVASAKIPAPDVKKVPYS
jgi:hypothetical protein